MFEDNEESVSLNMVLLIILASIFGFAAFWSLIIRLIAMGGWKKLAAEYRTHDIPEGLLVKLPRAQIGTASYSGVVKAHIHHKGLYLSTSWPFKSGHPPVFIPWSDIKSISGTGVTWTGGINVWEIGKQESVFLTAPAILKIASEGYIQHLLPPNEQNPNVVEGGQDFFSQED